MVGFSCPSCNYTTSKKSNYDRHISRKNKCNAEDIIPEFLCNYCNEPYSNNDNRKRHEKFYCKERKRWELERSQEEVRRLNKANALLQEQLIRDTKIQKNNKANVLLQEQLRVKTTIQKLNKTNALLQTKINKQAQIPSTNVDNPVELQTFVEEVVPTIEPVIVSFSESVMVNYKNKELSVAKFILENFPSHNWILDKKVGASRKRPDLLVNLNKYNIIIEIDENQHSIYDNETSRLDRIYEDLGKKPLVVIRFNPDCYISNGNKITTCWGNDINGKCILRKSQMIEWNYRLNMLKETVEYWMTNPLNDDIEVVKLFYDN